MLRYCLLRSQQPGLSIFDFSCFSLEISVFDIVEKFFFTMVIQNAKKRFQFFRDVKSEMKRVTWPTRTDVLRWSGVVVVALLFFGIFVALLDNVIITPLLVFISGIGA